MGKKQELSRETLSELLRNMIAVLQAANQAVPCVVFVSIILILLLIRVCTVYTTLMMGVIVLIVSVTSVIVFAKSNNYGEASLALLAGLLTAYTVSWTPAKFTLFVVVWSVFSLLALIICSVKLAATTEDIYRQAALRLVPDADDFQEVEARLKAIGNKSSLMGPINRAEVIRLMAFRKLPLDQYEEALDGVATLSIANKLDPQVAAVFITDLFKLFFHVSVTDFGLYCNRIFNLMHEAPMLPLDVITAFETSHKQVLMGNISLEDYLDRFEKALMIGLSHDLVTNYVLANKRD